MKTLHQIIATNFGLLILSCSAIAQRTSFHEPISKPESAQSQPVNSRSTAAEFVGIWEGGGKAGMGGSGHSKVRVILKPDGTFDITLHLFEHAHVLNPYPTSDDIEAAGTWSVQDHDEITLEATITKFVSVYQTGDAAQHGFLPDTTNAREVVKHLQLDPSKVTMTLFAQKKDGSRTFYFPTLQAKEKGTEQPVSRFIGQAPMKQTTSAPGDSGGIHTPGEE